MPEIKRGNVRFETKKPTKHCDICGYESAKLTKRGGKQTPVMLCPECKTSYDDWKPSRY
jgi:hypothetical protein